ncbi:MAG: DUF423 domain-containing protein [Pontibacterium sp.]
MLNQRMSFLIVGVSGFLAVALGAFGAHGLKASLSVGMMQVYHTAVLYHFIHTFALFGIALWMQHNTHALLKWAATFQFIGIVLFCGSLYVLATTSISKFGVITPLGGLAFLIGWALIGSAAIKHKS